MFYTRGFAHAARHARLYTGGPTGRYSFVEGLEMAKKKLKKAKKLSAGKSLRIFLKTAG